MMPSNKSAAPYGNSLIDADHPHYIGASPQ